MEKGDNILKKFGNKKPFSVPDHYFEDFAVEIGKQISSKKEKTVTVPFITKLKPYLYAAAMFALVLLVGDFLLKKTIPDNNINLAVTENIPVMDQNDLLLSYLDESALIDFLIEHDK